MDFVLYEGRTQVAADVQRIMQEVLDRYQTGILVSSVAIQNVQPPEQVQAAFDDAVKAGQDRERQINEGEAYKNQVVPLARGQASRMIEQAEGYRAKVTGDAEGNTSRFLSILTQYKKSPDVQRERMYLETMQEMFAQSSKVFIDTEASNSMLYLPLDKIMQQSSQGPTADRTNPMTPQPAVPSPGQTSQRPTLNQTMSNTLSRDRTAR
jgi:modulator of FtsH protease HflK